MLVPLNPLNNIAFNGGGVKSLTNIVIFVNNMALITVFHLNDETPSLNSKKLVTGSHISSFLGQGVYGGKRLCL